MAEPRIEIVGIYRLPVTEDLFRQQFEILYGGPMSEEQGAEAEEQCREQLSSIVLVEALIENRDERFSVFDFTQPQDGVPRDNWQVAYGEAFLTLDGNSLVVERWKEATRDRRFSGSVLPAFLGRDEVVIYELWRVDLSIGFGDARPFENTGTI